MKGLVWKIPVFAGLVVVAVGYAATAVSTPYMTVTRYAASDGREVTVETLSKATGVRSYLPGLSYRDGRTVITVTKESMLEAKVADNNNDGVFNGPDSIQQNIDGVAYIVGSDGIVSREGAGFDKSDRAKAPGMIAKANSLLNTYGSSATKAK